MQGIIKQQIGRITVFLMLCSLALLTATGANAQAKSNGPTFGHVDVAQVLSESKARQRDLGELNGMVQSFRTVMQQLQDTSARYLGDAEIKELASLYEKKTPTDADKKRITALEDQAAVKSSRKRQLENTSNPNDEQNKQLSELRDTEEKGLNVLKGMNDEYNRRLSARELELNNKLMVDIKVAIGKVAQEKGLSVVFDSQVAVWTANDVTADVVKALNK